jgi:hypothetical protein
VRDKRQVFVRPEACNVSILLDREEFVSGWAYPLGTMAPYAAATGFRFPAPVGTRLLRLAYEGCDVLDGETSSIVVELPIVVGPGQVSEVRFDGTSLVPDALRADSVVTLDDLYEAVTGKPKNSPK